MVKTYKRIVTVLKYIQNKSMDTAVLDQNLVLILNKFANTGASI